MKFHQAFIGSGLLLALLVGCVSPEEIERERQYELRGSIDCAQRGGVWYSPPGIRGECVTAEEARQREQEAQRRWLEQEREKDREAALTQACISSGGSHYSKYTGCMSGAFVHTPTPPVSPGGGAQRGVAFFKRDHVSGMNKICYYDRLGSAVAITIRATELCPLSLP